MSKFNSPRQQDLEYLLKTKTDADGVRRSKKTVRLLGALVGFVLILGPILYFHELGYARYVIGICAALGGILVFWGEANSSTTKQLESLHDFIDFEKVKSEIDTDSN